MSDDDAVMVSVPPLHSRESFLLDGDSTDSEASIGPRKTAEDIIQNLSAQKVVPQTNYDHLQHYTYSSLPPSPNKRRWWAAQKEKKRLREEKRKMQREEKKSSPPPFLVGIAPPRSPRAKSPSKHMASPGEPVRRFRDGEVDAEIMKEVYLQLKRADQEKLALENKLKQAKQHIAKLAETNSDLVKKIESLESQTQNSLEAQNAEIAKLRDAMSKNKVLMDRCLGVANKWFGNKTFQNTFVAWRDYVKFNRKSTQIILKVIGRMSNRIAHVAFNGWMEYWHECKQHKAIIRKVVTRIANRSLHMTFNSWVEFIDDVRRNRAILAKFAARFRNRTVFMCLEAWKELLVSKARNKALMQKVGARMRNRKVFMCFNAWHHMIVEAALRRQKIGKIVVMWGNRTTVRAFNAWADYLEEVKHNKRLMAKIATRWLNRGVAQCIASWKCLVEDQKYQRALVMRVTTQWSLNTQRKGWSTWVNYLNILRKLEMEETGQMLETRYRLLLERYKELSDELEAAVRALNEERAAGSKKNEEIEELRVTVSRLTEYNSGLMKKLDEVKIRSVGSDRATEDRVRVLEEKNQQLLTRLRHYLHGPGGKPEPHAASPPRFCDACTYHRIMTSPAKPALKSVPVVGVDLSMDGEGQTPVSSRHGTPSSSRYVGPSPKSTPGRRK